ncbi:MAG: tetratricopeptide repeat protein [Candidatus Helarchaeota archaeon]
MSHEEITNAVQRYNELLELAKNYERDEKYDAAYDIIIKAESVISKYASKSELGNLAYLKGTLLMRMGKYKKAEDLLKKALSISKETKGALDDSRITYALGDLHFQQSDMELALKYYLGALSIISKEYERAAFTRSHLLEEIIKEQIKQHLNLSEIYFQMNDLEKSMKHGKFAIELGEKINDKLTLLRTQHKLAQIEIKLGKYKTAFNRLIDTMELLLSDRKIKDVNLKRDIYYSLAEISLKQNNSEDAKSYIKKIYPLIKNSNSKLIEYYYKLGSIYVRAGSYKYAIKYFNKAIELSESVKSPLISKLLYEIGNIYYQMREYDLAVQMLKKCFDTTKSNFKLEGRINLLIGKTLFSQQKFEDAIYYFKEAYNIAYKKINDFKGSIIAKNYLGKIYYFQNKLMESLNEFNDGYYILRQLPLRNNLEISKKTLNKLVFLIIFNIIKLKIKFYENNRNKEELKEAIGYLEYLKFFNAFKFIRKYEGFPGSIAANWNKNLRKLNKLSNDLVIMDSKLKNSLNYKEIEKNLKNRDNLIKDYLSIMDKIWEKSPDGINSFPSNPSRIIDKFFESNITENWAILYIFYLPLDEKIVTFIIAPKEKTIDYKFKYIELHKINELIKKQIEFDRFKKQNKYEELNTILEYFSENLSELLPNMVIENILQKKYKSITIIPHKFLFQLPWELMKLKGNYLFSLTDISRHYSIEWLRIDINKVGSKKPTIFFMIDADHGTDLEITNADNEVAAIKSKFSNFKYDSLQYLDLTLNNYTETIKRKSFIILHYLGNLILNLNSPFNSKLKLFRHEYITPLDHSKYLFKQNPIIIIANTEFTFESDINLDTDYIYIFYRNLMISGSSGLIYSFSGQKSIDKTNFYLNLYQSLNNSENISRSLANSIRAAKEKNAPVGELYWTFIGNPFFKIMK